MSAQRTTLRGRAAPLARLLDRLEAAGAGRGGLVLLTGEPGIGKTRLAEELAALARELDMEVCIGRGVPGGRAPAAWPWIQVLRALCEVRPPSALRELLGAAAPVLSELLPELRTVLDTADAPSSLEPAAAAFRLHDAVASTLRRASRARPLLLLLDDLQDADADTFAILQLLASELAMIPLLVVAICRDDDLAGDHPLASAFAALAREAARIELEGLDGDAVEGLLASVLEAPPDLAALRDAVLQRTHGNPLFVLEIARWLAARAPDDAGRTVTRALEPLPEGIARALRQRLDRLSPACLELLEVAAVLGGRFRLDVLALASREGRPPLAVAALLDEAIRARLLTREADGATLRFDHDLVREVLVLGLGPEREAQHHRDAAEALRLLGLPGDEHLVAIADHYFRAAHAGCAEQAIVYCRKAGDAALRRRAATEAARHYRRALAALDALGAASPERRCDLLLALADVETSVDLRGARAAAREAATLATALRDPARLARAALVHPLEPSELTWAGRFDDEFARLLEHAIAALPPGAAALRARLLARLAPARPDREAVAREAVAIARGLDDPVTLVATLRALRWTLLAPDHTTERLAIARELVELGDRNGRPMTAFAGLLAAHPELLELGDRDAADAVLDRFAALAKELAWPALQMAALVPRAQHAFLDGDLAASEAYAAAMLALGRRTGSGDAASAYGALLLAIRREQGRLAEMEPALRALVARSPQPVLQLALALAAAEQDRQEAARAALAAAAGGGLRNLPRDALWPTALHFAGEVAVRLGDPVLAAEVHELLLPWRERHLVFPGTSCFGAASRLLGALSLVLGRAEDAVRAFEDALARNERLRAVPWIAHTRAGLAAALRSRGRSGDAPRAEALRAEALAAAERHGLVALASRG